MLKAILFDHDGTLVDSEKIHYKLLSEVLLKYGVTLSFDEYQKKYEGVPIPETAKKLVIDFSLDVSPEEIVANKKQATKLFLADNAFPLIDGARETIIHYHSLGLKLAVVTGASKTEGVLNTIERHQLGQYVSVVVTSDDVKRSKPAPDCYQFAMEKLGVKPEYCVAFEDSLNGCMSAVAAGVPCIGISSRVSQYDIFQGKTTGSFSNLAEANAWLRERFSGN
ncbi:HAD family phosphatase [Vibrio parahaemolyticus]|uniref:HAD family hydrolase n=1 Tax=Vibrio parahaemolyticus TaxID=670 RepID=UPI001FAE72AC|nr:HAD family phosphatase [Vibrio parahaemolyticus]EJE4166729.1 HAD family phosphatase [Vibrio parahaemolyticus]MCI9706343.1 HAD family phosphatase [Vibrio parahaemolyticus]MDF5227813.1 HAD family phosphatase [Vibrio parahaemolyticus]MDF5483218.1 HAD family phosphatase [Vibrio parahaemolyticus]MDG2839636.1 HAD family phosphatase [Vibrio parahaemolyticus]